MPNRTQGFLVPASVDRAGGQSPDFWAATRPRSSKISAPRLPGGRPSTPARRITRPAVVCAGILDVPALLCLGPRCQSAPRARVSALPAALLGRRLRRAHPQATRSPVPRGH
ncbi:hypothetical protein NDU88_006655 [Pleurodeles waltl]|uniref:Uncharacterized protein n=1 Tax=Pleurodeles waltl TaxID=8319 RepID=A0AAV7X4N8_PLEWA|nr:hypothetical protein NDU88_006655 [Pleurodeles waltl]